MTDFLSRETSPLPEIILGRDDYRLLSNLALAGGGAASAADVLLTELERAAVVPAELLPSDAVRMGSQVRYAIGDAERVAVLVYPAQADISRNRVSVLTPVGAALVGMRAGRSISFSTRDGRRQTLTVLEVTPPPSGDGDDLLPGAA